MKFSEMIESIKDVIDINSPVILAVAAGIGVAAVAVSGIIAGKKIELAKEEVKEELEEKQEKTDEPLPKKEIVWVKFKKYAPKIVPVAVLTGLTMFSIYGSYKISAKRLIAMTTAYQITDKALNECRVAMKQMTEKEQARLKEVVAQKKINGKEIPKQIEEQQRKQTEGTCEMADYAIKSVYYDEVTNQYFRSSPDELLKAANTIQLRLSSGEKKIELNDFFWEIADAKHDCAAGYYVGFTQKRNKNASIDLDISGTTRAANGMVVSTINYNWGPLVSSRDSECGDGVCWG